MTNRLIIGTQRYSSWSLRGWLAVMLAGLDVEIKVIPLEAGPSPAIAQATGSGTVPYLEHDGARVWDSLAIAEYCAERAPGLWPEERIARAAARSAAAEMHAGFRALRIALPMNTGRAEGPRVPIDAPVAADIARITALWADLRARFVGAAMVGPYLFGAFGLADAAFAPVVLRLDRYRVPLDPDAAAYCAAVLAHPLMQRWCAEAAAEPADWRLDRYESM